MVHTLYCPWCLRPEVPVWLGTASRSTQTVTVYASHCCKLGFVTSDRSQLQQLIKQLIKQLIRWVWHMHVMWPHGVTCLCSATLGHSWPIPLEFSEHVDQASEDVQTAASKQSYAWRLADRTATAAEAHPWPSLSNREASKRAQPFLRLSTHLPLFDYKSWTCRGPEQHWMKFNFSIVRVYCICCLSTSRDTKCKLTAWLIEFTPQYCDSF